MTSVGKHAIRTVLGSLRRVTAGGVEIELEASVAKENKASLEDTFSQYRTVVKREFDRLVSAHNVNSLHQRVAIKVIDEHVTNRNWRSTIYVADVLFASALYRLVDYYPKGGGRGLVYSARYGIIGRAWRLEADIPPTEVEPEADELIRGWGMTRGEAVHAALESSRKQFACVALEYESGLVGILYIDHKEKDGLPENLVTTIKAADECKSLAAAVAGVASGIAGLGPQLELFEES